MFTYCFNNEFICILFLYSCILYFYDERFKIFFLVRDNTVLLYCIVLYCIVLYCIVLYCIVLYCIVLYCIVLYCIVPLNSDSFLTELRPRRHFYMGGQSLPITIETSDRASQQLSSHILRILLTEVLGYEKVEIRSGYNSMNATNTLNRLAGCNTR